MSEENDTESEGKYLSKFKSGLSKVKASAQNVGRQAKEQVANPESTTRKVAHGFKVSGQAIAGEVNKAAKNEYVQRVGTNSVKMVRGEDDGLLSVHKEQKERAENSHMNTMFSPSDIGGNFTIFGAGSKQPQQNKGFGSGFSIMGENKQPRQQPNKRRNNGRTTVVVTRTVYKNKGRRKKRKQQQSEWTPF